MRGLSGPKPHEIRGGLGGDAQFGADIVLTPAQAGQHKKDDRPNAGFSGTPMWKLHLERDNKAKKEAEEAASTKQTLKIPDGFVRRDGDWYWSEKRQVLWNADDQKFYVWDNATNQATELYESKNYELVAGVGSHIHENGVQVRHIVVKDFAKAGQALRMSIDHLDRPCSLYALFEGHRGISGSNACAEFCSKQLHAILLQKLSSFRGQWDDKRLEEAMLETFEELDAEYAKQHPGSPEGCSGALGLLIGGRLVVASAGDIACVLCHKGGEAALQTTAHALPDPDAVEEESDSEDDGPRSSSKSAAAAAADAAARSRPIRWTRAFGDLDFKGAASALKLVAKPDVKVLQLQHKHQGFALVCRELFNSIGGSTAVSTVSRRCVGRPRMASGALVDAATQWLGSVGPDVGLGSVLVFFDKLSDAPPAKRARTQKAPDQVRLRHIVLKHKECKVTTDKVRNKQVKRSRGEAERLLRAVLEETAGDSERRAFTARCRELSECQSCLKPGELAGDLGWVKRGKYGQVFDDVAFALQVNQLSDLVDSDQGIHLVLRAA